jgi:hypothetical protein
VLRQIAEQQGWKVEQYVEEDTKKSDPHHLVVQTSGGYVHFWQNGKGDCWNSFERFGLNDPGPVLQGLEDSGFSTISEHEDFF